MAALRLGRVVEAQHGRRGAPADDPPARVEARLERGEAVRGPALGRPARDGRAATTRVMMPSVPSEPTNSWSRSGPTPRPRGCRRWGSTGRRRARRRGRRPCPRSCRSAWSTDRRRGTPASRRPLRCRSSAGSGRWSARARAEVRLRDRGRTCRAGPRRRRRSSSTATMPCIAVMSRSDAAETRDAGAAHAAAAAGDGERHPVLVAQPSDGRHLGRSSRPARRRPPRRGPRRRAPSAAPAATSRGSPRRVSGDGRIGLAHRARGAATNVWPSRPSAGRGARRSPDELDRRRRLGRDRRRSPSVAIDRPRRPERLVATARRGRLADSHAASRAASDSA